MKLILQASGYGLFGIGALGLFVPLLPTTIFWICAAGCFAKANPKMYRRIVTWPKIGPVVKDYLSHGVISRRSKHIALGGMAVAALILAVLSFGTWAMTFGLAGIAIGAGVVLGAPSKAPETSHAATAECPVLVSIAHPYPSVRTQDTDQSWTPVDLTTRGH